ncbi:MAG: sulfite exporter TauE/SafE family protein [Marinobacter sp.]|uniref:sulfite exporter TauE/SafE family protein n=1 Tax=Marinobacter sp. TaxID=50741 RepID=UPI00299EEADB|nr:sulfite exporter TauE/SafE family protein [Marinobacter sp.]MDX1756068.1 sulfite exporter TauE/SafE family protein [Marinobacter sp.]
MTDLSMLQYALIGLIFIWSGFVRSGLGFGGAVLSLPFLLLVYNEPLVYLPIISVHLLVFSSLTIVMNNRKKSASASAHTGHTGEGTVDWRYLWRILGIMIVPKLIGVFGLITLPASVMSGIILAIVSVYSLSYILNRPFRSNSRAVDTAFLMLGGYISGTSLIGAPLIIAVVAQQLPKEKLRDTLFALWFILVTIKMGAFIWAGVDLQLIHHLWLLPCAAIGHVIGLRFHDRMLQAETPIFFRVLGTILLVISAIGLWNGVVSPMLS